MRRKAQYELHFKKWKFQKNMPRDDWEVIARKIGKRKRENKKSEVYINGHLIAPKKVRKAVSRYSFTQGTTEMQRQGNGIFDFQNSRPHYGDSTITANA